jgi:hypothetical protein
MNDNFFEITLNDKTNKWALWLNGKIIKMASNEATLLAEVEKRGGTVEA